MLVRVPVPGGTSMSSRFCIIILAVWIFPGIASAQPEPARPMNIIFILSDDMGAGDLGCYGGTHTPTPNIDRLASEGLRFTHYYAAAPICSASPGGNISGMF